MKRKALEKALKDFLKGKFNSKGKNVFDVWIEYKHNYTHADFTPDDDQKEELKKNMKVQIDRHIYKREKQQVKFQIDKILIIRFLKTAAIFALLIGAFVLFREISLEMYSAKQVVENRVWVNSFGKLSKVTLPDNSIVWLNSASRLEYQSDFGKVKREISLSGEAFFEVVKNDKMPFTIRTTDLITTVKGTSFNIKSYPDDTHEEVSVESGLVEVMKSDKIESAEQSPTKVLLRANEKIRHSSKGDAFEHSIIDGGEIRLWTTGNLIYHNAKLAEITKNIERLYGIDVVFENSELEDLQVTFKQKTENLTNTLDALSYITGLEYLKKEKKVIFMDKEK